MSSTGTILVGTAGQGILRSVDDGASWHRLGLKEAIEFDGTVRALAVDPSDPSRVLAGADAGICLSTDGGAHFKRVDSPANGQTVWALAFSPANPKLVMAGTGAPSRAHMHRSRDGGLTWQQLNVELPEFCAGVNRPRILTVAFHPERAKEVWFGVEEGGAWRSDDAGDTWQRVDEPSRGINNPDIHAIVVLPATKDAPAKHLVLTVNAVCESNDDAQSFSCQPSKARFDGLYYTRTLQVLDTAGQQLLLAVGDGTPGRVTRIYRSEDRGHTWAATVLHTTPNSTVWVFGAHASNPQLLFAGTKYGHLLRSSNGGRSWYKEWRDFSEITSVAWTPFVAPVHAHRQSTD
ncbi:MAG: glycosyl hydrolase [Burkholderiales bacterium]